VFFRVPIVSVSFEQESAERFRHSARLQVTCRPWSFKKEGKLVIIFFRLLHLLYHQLHHSLTWCRPHVATKAMLVFIPSRGSHFWSKLTCSLTQVSFSCHCLRISSATIQTSSHRLAVPLRQLDLIATRRHSDITLTHRRHYTFFQ